jgi:hypothetical protein
MAGHEPVLEKAPALQSVADDMVTFGSFAESLIDDIEEAEEREEQFRLQQEQARRDRQAAIDAGRLKDVYGRLGAGTWDWASVSAAPAAFTAWLAGSWTAIGGKFGNRYAEMFRC